MTSFQWNHLEEIPLYELKQACQERNILPNQKCTKSQLISILNKYHKENPSRSSSRTNSPIVQLQNQKSDKRSRSPTPVSQKSLQKENESFYSKFIIIFIILSLLVFLILMFFIFLK